MILQNITIRNFRCFKEFSLNFGEKATVIFGKNGTGKTTLIHAIHKALSFIMYSDKTYVTEKIKGKRKRRLVGVKTITNNNPYLKVEGFSKSGDYNNEEDSLIEIESHAEIGDRLGLDWRMSAFATNNRLRPSGFIDAFRDFYNWYQQFGMLPVLAYYSDSFPHKEDKKKSTGKKKVSKLRNFGYFDWNAVEGCTKEWTTRLETNLFNIRQNRDMIEKLSKPQDEADAETNKDLIEIKSKEVSRWQHENDAIVDSLKSFSRKLLIEEQSSIEVIGLGIHSENRNLCVVTSDGKEISFEHLPSGYKRLFSLVLDLAYRCYILNNQDWKSAFGIALIDEIDLHLHPELENVVLNRLLEIFPNIQFIISTHSMNVLTNIATTTNMKIVSMPYIGISAKPQYIHDIYGIDINSGQQEVMGVTLNGQELKRLIDQCAYMISKNLLEQADRLKNYILSKNLISNEELGSRLKQKLNTISDALD